MGIVNINDDSFCNDGTLDGNAALTQAIRMAEEGADVVDVGAESARTNREAISIDEEIARLHPFLTSISKALENSKPRDSEQVWPPLISVNTWRPEVVEAVLPFGVDILNDIGGLTETNNATLCAAHDTALLIMHTVGLPKVPHFQKQYEDIWSELLTFFDQRITQATQCGLTKEQLILDPGIDFAKQCEDNLKIYAQLDRLTTRYESPVLLPISRKTVISDVLDLPNPNDRDAGTVACLVAGIRRGVHLFRVHNVAAMFEVMKVLWAVESQRV
ncbi:MAG: dihydropteroate synthase [Verrucomicrobiales bacterium]|jgi:dihydropteroate synthase